MPKCKFSSKKLSTNASRTLSGKSTSSLDKSLAGSVLSQSIPNITKITVPLDTIRNLKKKTKKRVVKKQKMSIKKPSQPSLFGGWLDGLTF